MSILLALLFPVAIQYERGGVWLIVLPVTLLAYCVDVLANYTELALLTWDWPRKYEFTFSQRLFRLTRNDDWRGAATRPVARVLNLMAPSGRHIQ